MKNWDFKKFGFGFIGASTKGNGVTKLHRFVAFFGASPKIVAILWSELVKSGWFNFAPTKIVKPVHFLMALNFLKCYNVEEVNAAFFNCDEKTFRQWSWFVLKGIAKISTKFVSFLFVYFFIFYCYLYLNFFTISR